MSGFDLKKHLERAENFPFSEGEKVLIQWNVLGEKASEVATIEKIYKAEHWGKLLVYGVTVTTKTEPKPFGVNHSLLEKVQDDPTPDPPARGGAFGKGCLSGN